MSSNQREEYNERSDESQKTAVSRLDEDEDHQHNDESQKTAVSRLGHYHFQLGDNITDRYQILKKLGEGAFGQVLECWDRKCQVNVAIKVTRRTFTKSAQMEIKILSVLAKHDSWGVHGCLQLKQWFSHQGHICMVSERLGPSLFYVLSTRMRRPFPLHQVRQIGKQILSSLRYVHERCRIIHTDLKPGNILMVSSEYKEDAAKIQVRLVDFGSAVFGDGNHKGIATTRNYRAPEVILKLGWSYPCDIWSVGCTLFELMTGRTLFQPRDNDFEHLSLVKTLLGNMPRWMMEEGMYSYDIHNQGMGSSLPRLQNLIQVYVLSPEIAREFAQLLEGMLQYDPGSRLTAAQALAHSFFKDVSLPTTSFSDRIKRWFSGWLKD